jgi:hypothetical protein
MWRCVFFLSRLLNVTISIIVNYDVDDRTISESGTVDGVRIDKGNRRTRIKSSPTPVRSPKIPHDLTWDRSWAVAVWSWRLTASAIARRTPCSSVDRYQPFGGTCCLCSQGGRWKTFLRWVCSYHDPSKCWQRSTKLHCSASSSNSMCQSKLYPIWMGATTTPICSVWGTR